MRMRTHPVCVVRSCLFSLFLMFFALQGLAVSDALFEASVVRSQDSHYDQREALSQVLVKLSGHAYSDHALWTSLLNSAESWVESYRYLDSGGVSFARYRFDQESVLAALQQHGVVPWLLPREKTLIILLLDHDGQTSLITDHSTLPITEQLRSDLQKRALPFTWLNQNKTPSLDAKELWQNNQDQIKSLLKKYQLNQAALIKLVFQPDERAWQGRMSVTNRLGKKDFAFENKKLQSVVSDIADGLLTSTYNLSKIIDAVDNQSRITLKFVGITSELQLQDLQKVLRSFAKVKSIELQGLYESSVTLSCELVGSSSKFMRELLNHSAFSYQAKVTVPKHQPIWVMKLQSGDEHA